MTTGVHDLGGSPVYERTAQTTRNGLPLTLIEAKTLELSGYGEPVTVERPANTAPAG
jgi:hypothetical protein